MVSETEYTAPRSTVIYTDDEQLPKSSVGLLVHFPGVWVESMNEFGFPRSLTPGPAVALAPGIWSRLIRGGGGGGGGGVVLNVGTAKVHVAPLRH